MRSLLLFEREGGIEELEMRDSNPRNKESKDYEDAELFIGESLQCIPGEE